MRSKPFFIAAVLLFGLASPHARVAVATPGEVPGQASFRPPDGRALYTTYCASCHGRTGRGDGPVAEFLKVPPSDLTQIARHWGTFSPFIVGRIIDGRHIIRAHGDSAMPVWGDSFRLVAGTDEPQTRARIEALIKHLEAMQQPEAPTPPR
jgi:mono/diheme cytochrome c family protein